MAIVLNIETSTQVCSVALAKDGQLLHFREVNDRNVHAKLLTIFIAEVLKEANLSVNDIDAIAVSKGPGSYTGLRIGLATAKGLCFALDKPLIAIDTLQAMSAGVVAEYSSAKEFDLLCPMIDARRMEVYTAFYSLTLEANSKVEPKIIEQGVFDDILKIKKVLFFGDGAEKCREALRHPNAVILDSFGTSARYICQLAEDKYQSGLFEDLAYFEPFYLKEFMLPLGKK